MFSKLLIANRGEIACRIIRTCREMGITTVAVYSDADIHALHVEMADEAIHLGGSAPQESYLNIDKIVEAAHFVGVDAIHPGYGFLAENPRLAYAARASGLHFIGPPPGAMEAMADKRTSKFYLEGIPLVSGYTGDDQSDEAFGAAAADIGYPIMIKASAGGGGKGMRRVETAETLPDALEAARREAHQAFGDDTLLLEHAIYEPRHVEVQIFGDHHGNIIALGERECSIQRRHQKIIEESPSTAITQSIRQKMFKSAVSIGKQLGYYSAGTVEFLIDDDGQFYFMEMNTRLQVEHPITEMVTGFDLVAWQIQIARGVSLNKLLPGSATADDYIHHPKGHAVEARIYAEDPSKQFLPAIGTILNWDEPSLPSIRVDHGIRSGDVISTHYDPLLAKISAHANTRLEAIRKLDYALSKTKLLGIRHNIDFLRRTLTNTDHLGGVISTHFVDDNPYLLASDDTPPPAVFIAAAFAQSPTDHYWRNNPNQPIEQTFTFRDEPHTVAITPQADNDLFIVTVGNERFSVSRYGQSEMEFDLVINTHRQRVTVAKEGNQLWIHTIQGTFHLQGVSPLPEPNQRSEVESSLRAPMPGQIIKVLIAEGQSVEKGDLLLIMEAMKMEHRIEAPYAGHVTSLYYAVGDTVLADDILLEVEREESNK